MPGAAESTSPSYISAHSADVILSEVRPVKLKVEALRSINVLLDEFLYKILTASRSLTTDKLRAGLLGLLPTTLGKEALLEAEVELRAYWDRTKPPRGGLEDDKEVFNLQWAFELLRLKCEAYSTLNESDEDPNAESRLKEKMGFSGAQPPKPVLIAPAALYLTAILESVCEHLLSNVGRVASRDSSRTSATVQDLFVALCEDDSIYGLFKTMKVYEQIELLSKTPKSRRSKSFSRSDKLSISRTSSSHQDQLSKDSHTSPPVSRLSSEATTPSASRTSLDKAKGMKKLLAGSRLSMDRDADSRDGHQRSDSVLSENTKQTLADGRPASLDDASLQDFDDLMRSDETMKVSLTPDRLKTMEMYKQEKEIRGTRRPSPLLFGNKPESEPPSAPPPPSRANGRRPSLRHVDSIIEDDEEPLPKPTTRPRQASVAAPPVPPLVASASRARSQSSAAHPGGSHVSRKSSNKSDIPSIPSSPPTATSSPPVSMAPSRDWNAPKGYAADPFPKKTRKIQHNRESLDLDDVMGGSDDEFDEPVVKQPVRQPVKKAQFPMAPPSPRNTKNPVSASTRALMDFLDEGPPEEVAPHISKESRQLVDFLAEGPPDAGFSSVSLENGKPKGSGRLQRMISKLSLSGAEKNRGSQDEFTRPSSRKGPTPSMPSTPLRTNTIQYKTSMSSLANRPIPPRPPRVSPPITPPSPPSSEDQAPPSSRTRQPSVSRKAVPVGWEQHRSEPLPAVPPQPSSTPRTESPRSRGQPTPVQRNDSADEFSRDLSPRTRVAKPVEQVAVAEKRLPPPAEPAPKRHVSISTMTAVPVVRKPPSPVATAEPTTLIPHIKSEDAQDLRRLVSRATTADECRLLLDMFLARSGVLTETTNYDVPYPSPSLSDSPSVPSNTGDALEHSLVEFFLGGEIPAEVAPPRKKRYVTRKKVKQDIVPPPTSTGVPVESRSNGQAVREDITPKYTHTPEVALSA